MASNVSSCWCGNTKLAAFSEDYLRCDACQTLVLARMPDPEELLVRDDEHDYYGRQYYERVVPELGLPRLDERARTDLTERCLHWLRYLLRHKLPPGKVLELGCAHGGFVGLLRAVGFDATGLELSPWLSEYARKTFDVPVLTGPVESQNIPASSLDAVILMDVFEHLRDPVGTLSESIRLLKPDGLLLIQTPRYREGKSLEQMLAEQDRFVEMLIPDQHLYLFSEPAVRRFLERLGMRNIQFEPAIFAHYDMFLAASREPLAVFNDSAIRARLETHVPARLPLALLDLDAERGQVQERLTESEMDRTARLDVIHEMEARIRASEAEREARLATIQELESRLRDAESRAADLQSQFQNLQLTHAALEARSATLERLMAEGQHREAELNAKYVRQRQMVEQQTSLLDRLHASHVYRAMRRLGLWGWLAAPAESDAPRHPVPSRSKVLGRVAVDLTPILPGGANGGAKVVVMELIRHISKLAPKTEFVLLTHERSHDELGVLDCGNVRRICVLGERVTSGVEKLAIQSRSALAKVLPAGMLEKASSAYRAAGGPKSSGALGEIEADLLFCPFTAPFFYQPGTPVVSLVHDLQFLVYPQFFSAADREERERYFQKACRVASRIVCVSEFVRGSVLANSSLPPERVVTIHTRTAARLSRSSPESRAAALTRWGLCEGRYLLYPANFWAHKNHEMLLTAVGMYAAAYPDSDLKLVLTGAPGPRRDELMDAATRMQLSERVLFPGFVPEEELAALMDGCLAVIFPSLFEGFGLPLLEAMAADKPVLASNLTSLPEVGGDAVLYFDPRRPAEIVTAIHRIEHETKLREMLREKGRRRLAYFGGPEQMASKYLEVLRETVSGAAVLDPGIYGVYEDGWAGEHITIAYPGNGNPQQLSLEVSLPPWAPMQALSVTVTPAAPGVPESHRVPRGKAVTISTPLSAGSGTLELHCTPTFQPKACAVGDDIRMLSCHVVRADIASADGHTTDLKALSHAV